MKPSPASSRRAVSNFTPRLISLLQFTAALLVAAQTVGLGQPADLAGNTGFFPLMAWNWVPSDGLTSICSPITPTRSNSAPGATRNTWNVTVSKQHGVAFWNIVLTAAHFNYREPTAADLRFQVYTTLAYGGRGIAYFTYFAPKVGNYRAAPIDQFGNATPTWDAMRNVNLQVAKLAPVLLELGSDDVYHFGSVPSGCHAPNDTALLKWMNGGEFVAGDFTHRDGSRFVLIVNSNFAKSRPCLPQFRVTPRRVQMVSPYTGELTPFSGEQQWLAAGQGVLLKLDL